MILFVEGPRACGKTYLIDALMQSVKPKKWDPKYPMEPVHLGSDVEYYKFYFADHIKTLGLQDLDKTPALHYFSLGNIMTIMEMNLRPAYEKKIWVFDRAIISAYTWAVLRGRLTPERAEEEYKTLLQSDLYRNCKTVFVTVNSDRSEQDRARNKDVFDGAYSTFEEMNQLKRFIEIGKTELVEPFRNNGLLVLQNDFNQASTDLFVSWTKSLLGLPA